MHTYRINEIFYSLQGEGRHTGRAAIFVRFSGCNLKCPFCDTDFQSYDELTGCEIAAELQRWEQCRFVVLTGGEPSLQVDDELVALLKARGYYLAMETNGTHSVTEGIDWVTLSPKSAFTGGGLPLAVTSANELKVVFDGCSPDDYDHITAEYRYLQPCDTGDKKRNDVIMAQCVEYIKKNPKWRLSLQTHKLINIP